MFYLLLLSLFLFGIVFVWFCYHGTTNFKNGIILSCSIFWMTWYKIGVNSSLNIWYNSQVKPLGHVGFYSASVISQ
jgi:hypothetical protein